MKIKSSVFSYIFSSIVLLAASNYASATLIYDEISEGDLISGGGLIPGGDLPQAFSLISGSNVINGVLTFSNALGIDTDADCFVFTIPDYSLLNSIVVDMELMPFGTGIFNRVGFGLSFFSPRKNPMITNLASESVNIPSLNNELFDLIFPLSPDTLILNTDSLSGWMPEGEYSRAAYTFTLNVSSVPEPSTITLLLMGVLGVGYARWLTWNSTCRN